jgi:hypothetical protein
MTTTNFSDKTLILSDLWLNYRNDDEFQDFIQYNDLGLPLAYAISEGIVKDSELSAIFINETFDLLLASMSVDDTGFESLDDLLVAGGNADKIIFDETDNQE